MQTNNPEIRVYSTLEEILELEGRYQRLFDQCRTAHIGNSFAYLVANTKVRRQKEHWRFYAAFRDDEMLGCIFGYKSLKRMLRLHVPAFILGYEFVSDALLNPDDSSTIYSALITRVMADQSDCLIFDFQFLTPDFFAVFSKVLSEKKSRALSDWAGYGYVVGLSKTKEQLLSTMASKTRAEINRKHRRLTDKYSVKFEFSKPQNTSTNLAKFASFLALENAGWKGARGTSILAREGNKEYFLEIISRSLKDEQIAWCELQLDDKLIAMMLCLRSHDTLWIPKVAYDENFSAFGPGIIATHLLMLECTQDENISLLNCISGPSWMSAWQPEKIQYRSLLLFNNSLKAQGLFLLAKLREYLQGFRHSGDSSHDKKNQPYV